MKLDFIYFTSGCVDFMFKYNFQYVNIEVYLGVTNLFRRTTPSFCKEFSIYEA